MKILKENLKRIAAFAFAFVMCFTAFNFIETPNVFAATTVNTVPITCRILGSSNVTTYVSVNGKVSGYIAPSDNCTILAIYSSGWVKVKYPIANNKTKTAYCKSSNFFVNTSFSTTKKTTAKNTTVYYKADCKTKLGTTTKNDSVIIVGSKNGNQQIIYNVSGGYKMGFVKGSLQTTDTGSKTALSYGLYKNNKAYISCTFDGYKTTSGRHEGIDVVSPSGVGAAVYSLTSGTVLRVAKGSRGSSGLSTIAIYNAETDKTVIYLHSNPVNIKAGDTVTAGQKIATMDWRGISSASGAHTHVEVRDGKQKYAAKSVNDYKLDNSNPTSFWNNKGYTIK